MEKITKIEQNGIEMALFHGVNNKNGNFAVIFTEKGIALGSKVFNSLVKAQHYYTSNIAQVI
jgi:hypothetical protein